MRRGFFSRIIVDARRPVPASVAVKSYPDQHPTADPSAHIESTKKDLLTQQQPISTDSEFRAASKPELPLMTRQEGNTSDSKPLQPISAMKSSGQHNKRESRQEKMKPPKGQEELIKQEKVSRLLQDESDVTGGSFLDLNPSGVTETLISPKLEVERTTAKSTVSAVENPDYQQRKEIERPVKEAVQTTLISFDAHRNDTQESAYLISTDTENSSNIEDAPEKTTFPEIHVGREAAEVDQDETDNHESEATQEASIAISHVDQIERSPGTAEPRHAPQVHIGQVEVVVIADQKEMPKQQNLTSVDDFSSRNYLRRL